MCAGSIDFFVFVSVTNISSIITAFSYFSHPHCYSVLWWSGSDGVVLSMVVIQYSFVYIECKHVPTHTLAFTIFRVMRVKSYTGSIRTHHAHIHINNILMAFFRTEK